MSYQIWVLIELLLSIVDRTLACLLHTAHCHHHILLLHLLSLRLNRRLPHYLLLAGSLSLKVCARSHLLILNPSFLIWICKLVQVVILLLSVLLNQSSLLILLCLIRMLSRRGEHYVFTWTNRPSYTLLFWVILGRFHKFLTLKLILLLKILLVDLVVLLLLALDKSSKVLLLLVLGLVVKLISILPLKKSVLRLESVLEIGLMG